MQMLSAKQIIDLATQSTTQAQIKELHEYALGKEKHLTAKGKQRRAAQKACDLVLGTQIEQRIAA
jgi:hypothetical protein